LEKDREIAVLDQAVVAGVFRSDVIPEAERMDVSLLVSQIQELGGHARVVADVEAIVQSIAPEMRSGDVVAILSNGGFGGIYEKLPQRLKSLTGVVSSKEVSAQA